MWIVDAVRCMFYLYGPAELSLGDADRAPTYLIEKGIPMFFIMIAMEWTADLIRVQTNKVPSISNYRLNDTLASIMLGSFQQISALFAELILGFSVDNYFYCLVYNTARITTIDSKAYPWFTYAALFIGKDFGYYLAHRMFHEYHALWVGHSAHHSGEYYNLATALRQGVLQSFTSWPFYLPLALLGFHPKSFSAHAQVSCPCSYNS